VDSIVSDWLLLCPNLSTSPGSPAATTATQSWWSRAAAAACPVLSFFGSSKDCTDEVVASRRGGLVGFVAGLLSPSPEDAQPCDVVYEEDMVDELVTTGLVTTG
jgi:hypothetical protein